MESDGHDAVPEEWLLDRDADPAPRPRGPQRRVGPTRRLRDRRGTILDAALTLFDEAGYSGASMQDIASEARASIGSVYHHFQGKEHIAAAIYVAGLADYHRGLLRELSRGHESAEAAVKALVRHHLRWVKANTELARFLLTSRDPEVVGASAHELSGMNAQVFRRVEELVERWVEAGEVQRLPIGLFHSIVLGPSQEFCRHWIAGRTKESIDGAEPVLAEAAWKAVRA